MPTPPPQTPESRAAALEKAAVSRRVRAEAKEKLKIGSLNLSELFAASDQTDEAEQSTNTQGPTERRTWPPLPPPRERARRTGAHVGAWAREQHTSPHEIARSVHADSAAANPGIPRRRAREGRSLSSRARRGEGEAQDRLAESP